MTRLRRALLLIVVGLLGYGIAEETRIPELVGRLAQAVLG